ncbi:MAG TPA: TonB family protein [Methyloceanibacter sp.]|nr:TonB family protein [Methyloceanibacter sp.]
MSEVESAVSEHRFLHTLATVSASSVLVCGTLLLLTSTAPWSRPPIEAEPSTPDAARLAEIPVELETASAPPVSDQTDTDFAATEDAADGVHTASTSFGLNQQALPEPVALAETTDADPLLPAPAEMLSPAEHALAALGSPPDSETSGEVEDMSPAVTERSAGAPDIAIVVESPAELAEATPPIPERPILLASADTAKDQIADLLNVLQARTIASDTTDAASEEVATMLAGLPPARPEAALHEKTDAATDQVAEAAVALPPAPEPATSETEPETPQTVAMAPTAPPPPLPRRKPESPPEPKVAEPAPVEETAPASKPAVAAAQPRERQVAQPAPQQQTPPLGGLFGFWDPAKPMALAPADDPAPAASRPATARPSSGAYASQVWARLARHKPRARQRGSASVAFAISSNGSLGAARIARSSGNARIDQLALQTVRSAAPFPPPPSGSTSYTIRIDF